jgi:hypothetical protein
MAKKKKKPPIHEDLEGFDISINPFGELESTLDIDKINEFLNKNMKDKKLPDDPEDTLPLKDDEEEMEFEDDEEWEEE